MEAGCTLHTLRRTYDPAQGALVCLPPGNPKPKGLKELLSAAGGGKHVYVAVQHPAGRGPSCVARPHLCCCNAATPYCPPTQPTHLTLEVSVLHCRSTKRRSPIHKRRR